MLTPQSRHELSLYMGTPSFSVACNGDESKNQIFARETAHIMYQKIRAICSLKMVEVSKSARREDLVIALEEETKAHVQLQIQFTELKEQETRQKRVFLESETKQQQVLAEKERVIAENKQREEALQHNLEEQSKESEEKLKEAKRRNEELERGLLAAQEAAQRETSAQMRIQEQRTLGQRQQTEQSEKELKELKELKEKNTALEENLRTLQLQDSPTTKTLYETSRAHQQTQEDSHNRTAFICLGIGTIGGCTVAWAVWYAGGLFVIGIGIASLACLIPVAIVAAGIYYSYQAKQIAEVITAAGTIEKRLTTLAAETSSPQEQISIQNLRHLACKITSLSTVPAPVKQALLQTFQNEIEDKKASGLSAVTLCKKLITAETQTNTSYLGLFGRRPNQKVIAILQTFKIEVIEKKNNNSPQA